MFRPIPHSTSPAARATFIWTLPVVVIVALVCALVVWPVRVAMIAGKILTLGINYRWQTIGISLVIIIVSCLWARIRNEDLESTHHP